MFQRYRTSAVLSIIFFALLAGMFWYIRASGAQAEETHFHAAFQMYQDNVLIDFSDAKYTHISPCADEEHEESDEEEQIEKAHLHDQIGDVLHVHRNSAKWKDLFKNISYDIDTSVVGYINGERVFGILNKKIHADDRAVFLIGSYDDLEKKLEIVPSIERIRDVEAASGGC